MPSGGCLNPSSVLDVCPFWRHPTTQISRKEKKHLWIVSHPKKANKQINKQTNNTKESKRKQTNKQKKQKTAKKLNNPNFHHTHLRPGFQCIHFLWTWTSQCSKPHGQSWEMDGSGGWNWIHSKRIVMERNISTKISWERRFVQKFSTTTTWSLT